MIDNDYPLGFKVALHRKDLGIALGARRRSSAPPCPSAHSPPSSSPG